MLVLACVAYCARFLETSNSFQQCSCDTWEWNENSFCVGMLQPWLKSLVLHGHKCSCQGTIDSIAHTITVTAQCLYHQFEGAAESEWLWLRPQSERVQIWDTANTARHPPSPETIYDFSPCTRRFHWEPGQFQQIQGCTEVFCGDADCRYAWRKALKNSSRCVAFVHLLNAKSKSENLNRLCIMRSCACTLRTVC